MKINKKVVALMVLAMALLLPSPVLAQWVNKPVAAETHHFDVFFHWGIIWKKAADAKLTTKKLAQNHYNLELIGTTASWADKVFKVRDTLTCEMKGAQLLPVKYVKHAHEGKSSSQDLIEYSHSGRQVTVSYSNRKEGGDWNKKTANVDGPVCDMVSMFHYAMRLDYSRFVKLENHTFTFFSGKEKENLIITFYGTEKVKMKQSKNEYNAYHITLKFSKEGKRKSGDDIDVWLSSDGKNTPLILRGKMSVGEIRCFNEAM